MKIWNNFISIIFTIVLCSCASFKSTQLSDDQVKITTDNFELLNGTFCLSPSNDNITGDIFWKYSSSVFAKDITRDSFYYIHLQNIGDRKLKTTFLDGNNVVLKTKTLTGRIKNGHFITNGRLIFLPLVIANVFGTKKIRIGLLENSNLLLDYKTSAFGTIFLYPMVGGINEHNVEYMKWEN